MIVPCVRGRDPACSETGSRLAEELVSCATARLLDPDLLLLGDQRNVSLAGYERDSQLAAERFTQPQLAVGLGSLAMVKVCCDELQTRLRHQVNETRRIRPATIADQRELSRLKKVALGDMALKAVEHSGRLPPEPGMS